MFGVAGMPISLSNFTPAMLNLAGWWQANFTDPWLPTASIGGSGTNGNLINGIAPSTGAAQNGYTPGLFNGTTQYLTGANAGTTYLSNATCSVWILANLTSVPVSAGAVTPYLDPNLFSENGGDIVASVSVDGFRVAIFDGAYKVPTVIPFTTGSYHLFQMMWDSTQVWSRVDGGVPQTILAGANQSIGNFQIGTNYAINAFIAGTILEVGTSQTAFSQITFDKIRAYCNLRYRVIV